ncbi:P-loop ATPase, Sll1717 family [Roseobacter fucihabitans]|nr:hypothetical protein [Roseobacter litoralis]
MDRVFVYADEFEQVISPPNNSPHILVGSKGSGKTAVLAFSLDLLEKQGIPAIILSPMDVEVKGLGSNTSTGDMARSFYMALLDSIITKLSLTNSGLFNKDYATLYSDALERNLRGPDLLSKFGGFISEIAKPLVGLDGSAAYSNLSHSTQEAVQRAVSNIVGKNSFYLFIDDTDQFADPNKPGHLNRVWALLLAARRLSYDFKHLRVVVTLRSEVWDRLQRDDHGQRDQTDHFRPLLVQMKSSREQVGRILDRRLALAAADAKATEESYQFFFEGSDARPPMSERRRSWRDLIVVRTRERPRDAIQLVNELAKSASRNGLFKVTEGVFHSVMPSFSRAISEQYGEEVRAEFSEALDYLKSFSELEGDEGQFISSADLIKEHLQRIFGRYGLTINGVRQSQSESSVFIIWQFLYASGVLNARASDASQKDGYRHLQASDDPFLVSKRRWNEMQRYLWEVDPVYRDYLFILKAERETTTGLPTREKLKSTRRRRK